jgi:hypothetical protein
MDARHTGLVAAKEDRKRGVGVPDYRQSLADRLADAGSRAGDPRPARGGSIQLGDRRRPASRRAQRGERKGDCGPLPPRDSVSIPHDIENRGVATGIDQELNSQVSGRVRVPPQVTKSARATSQGGDTGSNPVGTTRRSESSEFLSPPWSRCRHGLSGHTEAQVKHAEQAGPLVSRPAFVPPATHGGDRAPCLIPSRVGTHDQ